MLTYHNQWNCERNEAILPLIANLGDLLAARLEKRSVKLSFSSVSASSTDRNVGRSVVPVPAINPVLSEWDAKLYSSCLCSANLALDLPLCFQIVVDRNSHNLMSSFKHARPV